MKKVKVGLSLSAATISGIIVVVVILMLSLIFFTSVKKQSDATAADSNVTSTTPSTTTKTPAKTTTKKSTPKTIDSIPATGNAELIEEFSGYLFLFTENCTKVVPPAFTMKKGTKFVIKNGENKAHSFTFDKQKFTINPYEYAVVSTPTVGNQTIFCDGVQRASVNVQN